MKSTDKNVGTNLDGKLPFGMLDVEGKIGLDVHGGMSDTSASTARKILQKSLHDAAFDLACSYIHLEKVEADEGKCYEAGCFVEIARKFNFVDFDYLTGLFAKNGIVEYLKWESEKEIHQQADQATSSLNRDARRKTASNTKQRVRDAINASNKGYDEIEQILQMMRSIIPYDKMLVSEDGFVIPLEETYFRVNSKNIGFKFGGSMTCMGMISNIIGKGSAPVKEDDFFSTLYQGINEAMIGILPSHAQTLYVVNPIAVFYGD